MRKLSFQFLAFGILLVVLLLLPGIVFSQQETKLSKSSIRVRVDVKANKAMKNQVESYLKQELRRLGDVTVTNYNPNWRIVVLALEVRNKAKLKTGVVLSYVVLASLVDNKETAEYIRRQLDKQRTEIKRKKNSDKMLDETKLNLKWRAISSNLEYISALLRFNYPCLFFNCGLYAGAPGDLKRICEKIVADFESCFLEPLRETKEKMKKLPRER